MAKHAASALSPRTPPTGASEEAELTRKAQERLPREIESRYKVLAKKRDAESLTPSEYQELLVLTDQIELFGVQRLEVLVQLAKLRGIDLDTLIEELDFPLHV
jgi:hypothetical protein